ncbi:39S ribosomal protein L48, mitochondrial [Hylaeus anthracinus]|uniref:39S ribosomal protein L48, mitochondrial n=1 Tax=Hylaeus anthracinus TaxID=313031 RepID=UPI0023B8D1F1|nr:39S ribosomal protein L48, mitochondrial [Hylaeus anthracinus]
MALNVIKQVITCPRRFLVNGTLRFYSIYQPSYLERKRPGPPLYPTLNIQLRGYVFPLLESYQSYIYKVADILDIDVDDGYPFPHREYHIKKYKKESTVVDSEYKLKMYQRNIVISNVDSSKCPLLIRIIEAALPEGVHLHVDTYTPEMETKRYIPDKELLDMKAELENMSKPKK